MVCGQWLTLCSHVLGLCSLALNLSVLCICNCLNLPVLSICYSLYCLVLSICYSLHASARHLHSGREFLLRLLHGWDCRRQLYCQHLRYLRVGLQEALQQRQHCRLLVWLLHC
jgi:hypothetical protein